MRIVITILSTLTLYELISLAGVSSQNSEVKQKNMQRYHTRTPVEQKIANVTLGYQSSY